MQRGTFHDAEKQVVADNLVKGKLYLKQKKYHDALKEYEMAVSIDNNCVPALLNIGRIYLYYLRRPHSPTIKYFNRVLKLDPKNIDAYEERGHVFCLMGRLDDALTDFCKVIRLDPTRASAYTGRAHTHRALLNFGYAMHDYAKALELDKNDRAAQVNLRWILSHDSKNSILRDIKQLPPDEQVYLLNQCLDKNTVLGERFWKMEGFFECTLESGTLKEISDLLKKLTGSQQPATLDSVNSLFNVHRQIAFTDNTQRKKTYPDLNDVVDKNIYRL